MLICPGAENVRREVHVRHISCVKSCVKAML